MRQFPLHFPKRGISMYVDAHQTLDDILVLVNKCPESLKEKCFELLLNAYLESKVVKIAPAPYVPAISPSASTALGTNPIHTEPSALPEALKSRFGAAAGRIGVTVTQLGGLFDFQLDPYNYHALNVTGNNKADKSRNVGLLLCAKSYLTMSDWSADWKEFRAVCIDQECWDKANISTHLGRSGYFKVASAGEGLMLNGSGVEAAQALLAQLIQGQNAAVK